MQTSLTCIQVMNAYCGLIAVRITIVIFIYMPALIIYIIKVQTSAHAHAQLLVHAWLAGRLAHIMLA